MSEKLQPADKLVVKIWFEPPIVWEVQRGQSLKDNTSGSILLLKDSGHDGAFIVGQGESANGLAVNLEKPDDGNLFHMKVVNKAGHIEEGDVHVDLYLADRKGKALFPQHLQ